MRYLQLMLLLTYYHYSLQVRYLQLTLRHHAASAAAGGGNQRAEPRKGDNQRGERASCDSVEGGVAPYDGRGDNQRTGGRRPRFIVLDLTQVHRPHLVTS